MNLLTRCLLLVGLIGWATVPTAGAEVCVAGQHVVRWGETSVRIRDFNCPGADGAAGAVRISFYRVSETVAGALLKKLPLLEVEKIFGDLQFVDNDVLREAKTLFERFGRTVDLDSGTLFSVLVNADSQTVLPPGKDASEPPAPQKAWYLSRIGEAGSDAVLLSQPSQVVLNTNGWPSDYNMTYRCPEGERVYISCTIIWKYLGVPDFDAVVADVRRAYRRAEAKLRDDPQNMEGKAAGVSAFEANINLFKYLDRYTLPNDFLYIKSSIKSAEPCGSDNWSFEYSSPSFLMDFVTIENRSKKPIELKRLLGRKSESRQFREVAEANAMPEATGDLGLGSIIVPPNAAVAIAQRTAFTSLTHPFFSTADSVGEPADVTYARIRSRATRASVSDVIGGFTARKRVTKTKQSFSAPATPKARELVYGPQIGLTGFETGSRQFELRERPSNDISLIDSREEKRPTELGLERLDLGINKIIVHPATTGECCPILYSRNARDATWMYHGKVLHVAHGRDRAARETIELPELRTRIRIAESEPEVAFIEHVRLRLTLRGGRQLQIAPVKPMPAVVRADTAAEAVFELPSGVSATDVTKTEVQVAGYYQRYDELLLQAAEREEGGVEAGRR